MRSGARRALRPCTSILALTRVTHKTTQRERHSSTTSVMSLTWAHPGMPNGAACTAATAQSLMRAHHSQPNTRLISHITSQVVSSVNTLVVARSLDNESTLAASHSRSRPKSHRPSEPSSLVGKTSELDIAADSPSERCACSSSPSPSPCETRAAKVDKTR